MGGVRTIRVTDRVFAVQRKYYLSCSYFVLREKDVILIDSGIRPDGNDMRIGLQSVGRSIDNVSAILLTHWHNDHSSGAAAIAEQTGARVYFHQKAQAKFSRDARSGGMMAFISGWLPDVGFLAPIKGLLEQAPPRAVRATEFVREGMRVENEFVAYETPGHDAGHLSYLYEPERVLFTGDALGVAGNHVTFISRALTQNISQARESMIRCLEFRPAAYCPGHRYPLVGLSEESRQKILRKLANLKRWPLYGA